MAKLTNQEFTQYCIENNISDASKAEIEFIRSSNPARNTESSRIMNNVSGKYPSIKMGVTIQFESRHLEEDFVYILEYDDDVLEYYDQPPSIRYSIKYPVYTPDFFVIRKDRIEWVECKMEDALIELSQKYPDRYQQDQDGNWHSPILEAYAGKFGFHFRIFSFKEINKNYVANLRYLESYLRTDDYIVSDDVANSVKAIVNSQPGISLQKLINTSNSYTTDDINKLIITGGIYTDLYSFPLHDTNTVKLFKDIDTAERYKLRSSEEQSFPLSGVKKIKLKTGSKLLLDNEKFIVTLIGDMSTYIQAAKENGKTISITNEDLNTLILKKQIIILDNEANEDESIEKYRLEKLTAASPKDKEEANRKYAIIMDHLNGVDVSQNVPQRTLSFWLKRYKEAETIYGSGYIGLLPDTKNRGNRRERLDPKTKEIIESVIEQNHETYNQPSAISTHITICGILRDNNLEEISYPTTLTYIDKRDEYQQTLSREGHRRASVFEGPALQFTDSSTHRHGSRAFEHGHIDHTLLDIRVRTGIDDDSQRVWISILMDSYTRRILASYITFDEPSYRSCMMLIRDCVRRHNKLPQNIMVDGGKEFKSIYFESLLAQYEVTLKFRPPTKGKFGSVCERFFGTLHSQFVHTLTGNTQATKNVRTVTKSTDPKNLAIWDFDTFLERLNEYTYNIYDNIVHTSIGRSPKEQQLYSIKTHGERINSIIAYDESFKIITMPSTQKGRARIDRGRGIKVHYLYYWAESFRNIDGKDVPVRYDPFDITVVYAYVRNQWVKCLLTQERALFSGMSEKTLRILTTMMLEQMRITKKKYKITARSLAQFYRENSQIELILKRKKYDENVNNMIPETTKGILDAEDKITDTVIQIDEDNDDNNNFTPCELY